MKIPVKKNLSDSKTSVKLKERLEEETMVRFFVTPEELLGEVIALRDENAQHAKVLRLKAGE